MKRIIYILIFISLITNYKVKSQTVYIDHSLLFSSSNLNGTARFMSMGGAFGALGGDVSSLTINPAGLGIYRTSEFMFSPGVTFDQTTSNFLMNNTDDNLYKFGLSNIGFVSSYDLANTDSRWINANFSISYNKTNDYNSNALMTGSNVFSVIEEYVYRANEENIWSPNYEELFWETWLFNEDTLTNLITSEITDTILSGASFSVNQQKALRTSGSTGEFLFAFGANYAHKLYIGASIGIYRLNYEEQASMYEYENSTFDINNFHYLKLDEVSKTNGTGVTFKLGAIYKPVDFLRLGLAFHLPTFYELEETFYTSLEAETDTEGVQYSKSETNKYKYTLTTPYKVNASVGFQIAKFALIDVDYEYIDYSTMKRGDKDNSQGVVEDNRYMDVYYQSTHNIRTGAEVRFNTFYIRGGFTYSTSPYTQQTINEDSYNYSISGGVGYRQSNFYMDFGMKQYYNNYNYAFITGNPSDMARIDQIKNNFALTVGFKF